MKILVISVSTGKLIDFYDNAEKRFFFSMYISSNLEEKTCLLEKSCYACKIVVAIFI
jgi:hypothetical protein